MAKIAVVGAHGKVAQQLLRLLYDDGDDFVGIVRGEEHADDIYRLGGDGVLLDIERATPAELAAAFSDSDAVVFTAGAGADPDISRKRTVDFEGSLKSQEAARLAGIRRYVQVSAIAVDDPATLIDGRGGQEAEWWAAYVSAKRDADAALRESGLDWTIVRPGSLTSDEGTGLVTLGETVERGGSIPRSDVAAVIVAALETPGTIGRSFELVAGDTPIDDAIANLIA